MKKEMNRVIAGPHEEGPINIIKGRLLEAQITDIVDPESGEICKYLEFWLKDEFQPDEERQNELSAESETPTFVNPEFEQVHTGSVSLYEGDQPETILHMLDCGMLYIFSHIGIDHAKLLNKGGSLVLQDTPNIDGDFLYSDAALYTLSNVFEFRRSLEFDDWDFDMVVQTLIHFNDAMDWGDLERKDNGDLVLTGLCDPAGKDEDIVSEQQEVTLTWSESKNAVHMYYVDDDGELEGGFYPLARKNIESLVADLHQLGLDRGASTDQRLANFQNIYEIFAPDDNSGAYDFDDLVEKLVEKHDDDPRIQAAMAAFDSLDTSTPN